MKKQKLEVTIEAPAIDRRTGRKPTNAFVPGNVHAFKPGKSGNISGKPKDQNRLLSRSLRAQLSARAPDLITKHYEIPRGSSWSQCIAAMLIRKSVKGDLGATRTIGELTEPRAGIAIGIGAGMIDEDGSPVPVPALTICFEGERRPRHLLSSEIDLLLCVAATFDAQTSNESKNTFGPINRSLISRPRTTSHRHRSNQSSA